MNYLSDLKKPTIFTGENYGKKVSVQIDHADIDINEVMEAFETIVIGLGFSQETWKQCIIDKADEYGFIDNEEK